MQDTGSEPPISDTEDKIAAAKKAEINRKKREKAKAKKVAAKAVLKVELLNADEYLLSPPTRVDQWFDTYQEAFAVEHEWMEARKQKTSRGLGLKGPQMLPLVFHDEAGIDLTRITFFARYDTPNSDAVGYATVDVDPDTSKVCHLRMLLVAPALQRQGVGLTMLKALLTYTS